MFVQGWRAGIALMMLAATAMVGLPHSDAEADTRLGFHDNFNGAVDNDPTYGLNDNLASRQLGSPHTVPYQRVSGVWYPAPEPRPWYSQVGHSRFPDRLSLWLGHSAVRLEAPVLPGPDGRVIAQVSTDPVVGEEQSGSWASMVLARDNTGSGYVSDANNALAVVVRSNGGIQIFDHGQMIEEPEERAVPDANGRFRIGVTSVPGESEVNVTVNSTTVEVGLSRPFPHSSWLHLGAYLANDSMTTTFDDLDLSAVGLSSDTVRIPWLRHFGYYAARITENIGNHVPEVRGRSNSSWVNISDFARYAPEVLDACAPQSCVIYTGHEFFKGCNTENSPTCDLYPNYQERWDRLADIVRPYLTKVAAFYVQDEPFHLGASAEEVEISAKTIKRTFPDIPVMMSPFHRDDAGHDGYAQSGGG
ncbi:hypothetical protein ACSDR0_09465 [Streptosporangium sp. G11]|uniref:hypothetical protein n=1 Tax=Streptosporangium sp. G11 TaxID=3436926 RepID=UPI003EB7929E